MRHALAEPGPSCDRRPGGLQPQHRTRRSSARRLLRIGRGVMNARSGARDLFQPLGHNASRPSGRRRTTPRCISSRLSAPARRCLRRRRHRRGHPAPRRFWFGHLQPSRWRNGHPRRRVLPASRGRIRHSGRRNRPNPVCGRDPLPHRLRDPHQNPHHPGRRRSPPIDRQNRKRQPDSTRSGSPASSPTYTPAP